MKDIGPDHGVECRSESGRFPFLVEARRRVFALVERWRLFPRGFRYDIPVVEEAHPFINGFDHMRAAIFRYEQCSRVFPFKLNIVIMQAFGNGIELSP